MKNILEINDLSLSFPAKNGERLTILNHISFHLRDGEILGLIGNSG